MKPAIDPNLVDSALQRLRDINVTGESIDALLTELGRRLDLDPLQLDENRAVDLTFDNQLPVSLIHLDPLPGLVAASPVTADQVDGPAVMVQLLQANMSWTLTHGGSFGMIPGRDEPMLMRLLLVDHEDAARLEQDLSAFIQLAQAWRERLSSKQSLDAVPTGDLPPPGGLRV